ncbi:MAG: HlyD family efflux transporter periplasmic adaptor subunit [Leptolyngbyaceae cyanobacterium CSU_1_3]|nr:HlyD family efflux transporter periplasmic adaptor subunit [Leptolyngbyaceae cyanobacterium CSU_1_3]
MVSYPDFKVLATVQPEEFLPPMSRWVKFGGLIIVGVTTLAIAASAIARYKVTVRGQAVIRPIGEIRLVQAAAEGRILNIAITENQPVHRGDVIATIDDSQLQTRRQQLQTSIQQAQLQILQINAQIQALDGQITAETSRVNLAIISSKAELTRRSREYRDRKMTAISEVDEASARQRSTEAALKTAQVKWQRYKPLTESGALSKDELEQAQLSVQQQHQEVAAAMAGVQRAQTMVNPTDAEVAIATAKIGEEQAAGVSAIASLNKEREALIQQRIQVQQQVSTSQQDLHQTELDLKKTTITATADGIVSKLNLRNADQTVALGQEIAMIVPSDAKLMIKAIIGSQDLDTVKVGQKTQLRVSACPYTDYGTLHGNVKTISPDAIAPPSRNADAPNAALSQPNNGTAAQIYEVTIEPQSLALTRRGKECRIQPGMEGRVDIISKEETVLQWLLRRARFITDM